LHSEEQSLDLIRRQVPTFWKNPHLAGANQALSSTPFTRADFDEAHAMLPRFADLLVRLFPEADLASGQIESPLLALAAPLAEAITRRRSETVLVKADHSLPITGSIKARGAIYEVLLHAESVALCEGLLQEGNNRAVLAEERAARLFSGHSLIVGSTGNLGFSIGVIGRALGFCVEVHMSSEAKAWKKARLTALGARVVEHAGDYTSAVAAARGSARANPNAYFIDDENSDLLLLGYSSAAPHFASQVKAMDIEPTPAAPLEVFLPCGVGGAPAGITLGLKMQYGDAVRCIFVEPVASPCMLLQLMAGLDRLVSVYDFDLDNRTIADGLSVPRASLLAAQTVRQLVDGVATVSDESLLFWTAQLWHEAGMKLEPSAVAGFAAARAMEDGSYRPCARVIWTTGGSLLPDQEFQSLLDQAKQVGRNDGFAAVSRN